MEKPNVPGKMFSEAYNAIDVQIPYDKKWEDEDGKEGRLPYIHHSVKLNPGEIAKSTDHQQRRIIMIGTRFGTVSVHDRFPEQQNGGFYTTSTPVKNTVLSTLLSGAAVGQGEMAILLGSWNQIHLNIGDRIEKMYADFIK